MCTIVLGVIKLDFMTHAFTRARDRLLKAALESIFLWNAVAASVSYVDVALPSRLKRNFIDFRPALSSDKDSLRQRIICNAV